LKPRSTGNARALARLPGDADPLGREDHPSYYGAAVVALTRTMLESRALGRC